jgi:hypothetical protein
VGGLVLQSPLRGKELGMFHVKHFSQVFGSLLTGRKPCGRAQSLYCAFSLAGGRAAQYAIRVKNAHGYCTYDTYPVFAVPCTKQDVGRNHFIAPTFFFFPRSAQYAIRVKNAYGYCALRYVPVFAVPCTRQDVGRNHFIAPTQRPGWVGLHSSRVPWFTTLGGHLNHLQCSDERDADQNRRENVSRETCAASSLRPPAAESNYNGWLRFGQKRWVTCTCSPAAYNAIKANGVHPNHWNSIDTKKRPAG